MATTALTDVDKCLRLADVADKISMRHFRSVALQVQTKPDRTPVTEADLAVDKALHDIVTKEYGDAYLSEEGDQTPASKERFILTSNPQLHNELRKALKQ